MREQLEAAPPSPEERARRLFAPPSLAELNASKSASPIVDPDEANRRRLLAGYEERQRRVMGTLIKSESAAVRAGNHRPVDAHRATYAGWLSSLHKRIHSHWAESYLPMLDTRYPPGSPLQDRDLRAVLEFVIRADTGAFEKVTIVRTSGQLAYDGEATSLAWKVGPQPNAPPQIVSPDGRVYVHWTFWRDARQCGPFGASVYVLTEGGAREQLALPEGKEFETGGG